MGFLDAVMGKGKLPKAKVDKLFAISTASITMDINLGLKAVGSAGICFKAMDSSRYAAARLEIEELLQYSCKETGTEYKVQKDEFNYLWVILKDPDFEDLVTNIHLVSQTLIEHGFSEQLLCAIYRFHGEGTVYWIYNYKQGAYYPFVPKEGHHRDNKLEFRLRSVLESELPIEKNVEKWYPLWGIPI
jgi:hypothetical protein